MWVNEHFVAKFAPEELSLKIEGSSNFLHLYFCKTKKKRRKESEQSDVCQMFRRLHDRSGFSDQFDQSLNTTSNLYGFAKIYETP